MGRSGLPRLPACPHTVMGAHVNYRLPACPACGVLSHMMSHIWDSPVGDGSAISMLNCSFFTPSRSRAYNYCVGFLMLQEFILGKKCFFFLYALGNVIQQECSQEPIMAERRMGLSRGCMSSYHPCPSLPGLAHRAVAPLGAPSVLLKLCPMVLGDISSSSRGRREGADAGRRTSCSQSHSCCRGSWFHVLSAVPVASSTSSSGWSLQEMLEVPPLWCVIIQASL